MSTRSKLPFTSVLSYHLNPMTCGVAKFGAQLADRLGVPFGDVRDCDDPHPLFSLKWSEVRENWWDRSVELPETYSVFWHDAGDKWITDKATTVYYADPSLGPEGLWCPSLLEPAKPLPIKLFSFGMAHKLQPKHYERVSQLLWNAGVDFHLRVSVGLHEGTDLSDATRHFDALKQLLGPDKVTILGILSDEAVALELQAADYVLAFFEHGLRANNTTVHAALMARKTVITNHDRLTPAYLKAATRDIHGLSKWMETEPYHYSWDRLLERMEEQYARTENRQAAHR